MPGALGARDAPDRPECGERDAAIKQRSPYLRGNSPDSHIWEAASRGAQTARVRPLQNGSRSARFWILPLPVLGSSARKSIARGHL